MYKIGITLNIPDSPIGLFSNGIGQNVIFLYELFSNMNYDVYFIVINIPANISEYFGMKNKKLIEFNKIKNSDFDIIIQMGITIPVDLLETLQKANVKTIAYKCGNDYFFETEQILFKHGGGSNIKNQTESITEYNLLFDEIWSIPQMAKTNISMWKTLYRTKCIEIPFVWSPSILEEYEKSISMSLTYKPKESSKKCAIFEPNLNFQKWFYPALLVCENAYRVNPSLTHVYITNIKEDSIDMPYANSLLRSFDLVKNKKVSIESRYNSLYFLTKYADIAVSHQFENPLNYLYLDLAWMGWPIVHNAHLCKDVGYYYNDFDYEEGGKMIDYVISNHDNIHEEYREKNRKLLDRYLPTNKQVQATYAKLINDLMQSSKPSAYDLNIVGPIPKIIFQTSQNTIPSSFIVNKINSINAISSSDNGVESASIKEWEYKHFNDSEILEFFNENYLQEFSNISDKFKCLVHGSQKADLFKFYYLYTKGGVYLDYNTLLEQNVEKIIDSADFVCVKNSSHEKIFHGFIGSTQKNPVVYKFLQNIYSTQSCLLDKNTEIVSKSCFSIFNRNKWKFSTKIYSLQSLHPSHPGESVVYDETPDSPVKLLTNYLRVVV
jgi:hypothetical protein